MRFVLPTIDRRSLVVLLMIFAEEVGASRGRDEAGKHGTSSGEMGREHSLTARTDIRIRALTRK